MHLIRTYHSFSSFVIQLLISFYFENNAVINELTIKRIFIAEGKIIRQPIRTNQTKNEDEGLRRPVRVCERNVAGSDPGAFLRASGFSSNFAQKAPNWMASDLELEHCVAWR